jgi:hypothetical protein
MGRSVWPSGGSVMTRVPALWQRLLPHFIAGGVLIGLPSCAATATQPSSSTATSSSNAVTTTPSPPACSVRVWACTSTYGAIAYSTSTRAYGFAYNYSTRAQAESAALGYCAQSDCGVVVWFSNSCGALATAPTGQWATGLGSSGDFAQASALAACVLK